MADKFDRHLVKPKELRITNEAGEEDVFTLYPLPFQYIGDMFELMSTFTGFDIDKNKKPEDVDSDEISTILEKLDKKTMDKIALLIQETMKISYPDQDEKKLSQFASAHFMELFPVIIELNLPNMATAEQKK